MFMGTLDKSPATRREKLYATAALFDAKVKDPEIIRILLKFFDIDRNEATDLLQNERFINAPCRNLEEYLICEKGYPEDEADYIINRYAKSLLASNTENSKLSPAKLFAEIEKKMKK